MRRLELPSAFSCYRQIGGVLEFAAFDELQGDRESAMSAIEAILPNVNRNELRKLGFRTIDKTTFFGDWFDADTDSLVARGSYTLFDGRTLVNPRLREFDGSPWRGGAIASPKPGDGGEFAYAFCFTPYGLRGPRREIEAMFREIRDFLTPPGEACEILDWASPDLPRVSKYFEAGMEWWGVFLFTIYVPAFGRLSVIAGSTTD